MAAFYITVEGETERTFAEAVLRPHLTQYSLDVRPLVVITNRKLGTRGGVLDFATIRDDLRRMMRQDGNHDALFTTMVDSRAAGRLSLMGRSAQEDDSRASAFRFSRRHFGGDGG